MKNSYRIYLLFSLFVFAALLGVLLTIVFVPIDLPYKPYSVVVVNNNPMRNLVKKLSSDGLIRSQVIMRVLARLNNVDKKIKAGKYTFYRPVSMWQMLEKFAKANPDQDSITIVEGLTFVQFREKLNKEKYLHHDTLNMNDSQILKLIGSDKTNAEGLFFPSTYFYAPNSSDIDLLRMAYKTMQKELNSVWSIRSKGLPYKTPYEMLIMASLIEKEAFLSSERRQIAAVFVNRLKLNMRLQTDPSVAYGMGSLYTGKITKADLHRDTPYNTYTRNGLTPTPIALPGRSSLIAAANPVNNKMLYFVARGDGSSEFSATLAQHIAAVRKYILKKGH